MVLGRVAGYYFLAVVALVLPEAGENRFLVAGLLAFVCAPLALIVSFKVKLNQNGVADPLVDMVTLLILVSLMPEYWFYGLLIGTILALAPSIAISRFSHWYYVIGCTLLIVGLGVIAYVHSVPDALIPLCILISVFPPTVAYAMTLNQRSRQMRERAESLSALQLVSGGIAHDFNNILTGIAGYADFARSGAADPRGVEEALTRIVTSTERASLLTKQLIMFAGDKKAEMRPVNLNREIQGVIQSVEGSLPHQVLLRTELPSRPVMIHGDPVQLSQVIMNLVINGIEAIEGPGEVVVRLRSALGSAWIEVEDTGSGIAPERQAKIFEPFETSKRSGHGLGLAVVKGIVDDHQGDLEIQSELGQGSLFALKFATLPDQPATDDSGVRPNHILIADDEQPIRSILRQLLEAEGYAVLEASDGREFSERFAETCASLCAVILDVRMPGKTGWQCMSEIRESHADLPVLMISGYDPEGPTLNAPDRAMRFLAKPFRIGEVKEALAELIQVPQEPKANTH